MSGKIESKKFEKPDSRKRAGAAGESLGAWEVRGESAGKKKSARIGQSSRRGIKRQPAGLLLGRKRRERISRLKVECHRQRVMRKEKRVFLH